MCGARRSLLKWWRSKARIARQAASGQERAILVGLEVKSRPRKLAQGSSEAPPFTSEESLEELHTLAASAGAAVEATGLQSRPAPDAANRIGSGKLKELRATVEAAHADTGLFAS